jgi:uncharacterized DUF497 family protein
MGLPVHLGSTEGGGQSSEARGRVPRGRDRLFAELLSLTIQDPDHSIGEERFVLIGQSEGRRLVVAVHVERGDLIRIISARLASGRPMKKKPSPKTRQRPAKAAMRREYDFTKGVRGKYAARLRPGSQVVVLDPDVAAAFGDAKAVNRALRTLMEVVPKRPPRRTRRRTA